jgi:hypothetical protein
VKSSSTVCEKLEFIFMAREPRVDPLESNQEYADVGGVPRVAEEGERERARGGRLATATAARAS